MVYLIQVKYLRYIHLKRGRDRGRQNGNRQKFDCSIAALAERNLKPNYS